MEGSTESVQESTKYASLPIIMKDTKAGLIFYMILLML